MTSERDRESGAKPQTEVLSAEGGLGGQSITIGGAILELDTLDAELLALSLRLGRAAINRTIIVNFIKKIERNTDPDLNISSPAPLWVVQFGVRGRKDSGKKKILTAEGYANRATIHEKREEIQEPYHPYWDAVVEGGFRPEVRRGLAPDDGIWLMLHRLETGETIRIGDKYYEV